MAKRKRVIIKCEGEEFILAKWSVGSDGSTYIVPCPDHNKRGFHLSAHSSGILNIKTKDYTIDEYNVQENDLIDKNSLAQQVLNLVVPMTGITTVIVLKKLKNSNFITHTDRGVLIDLDQVLDYVYDTAIEYDILSEDGWKPFLKYDPEKYHIVYCREDGVPLLPFRETPHLALPQTEEIVSIFEKTKLGRILRDGLDALN